MSAPARGFLGNVGWNLAGQVAPLAAAVLSIPILIAQLGMDRFGLLTIGWMVIGYFSLFDLGIGRAMTQLVAVRLARDDKAGLPPLVWTGMSAMLGFGAIGSLILILLADAVAYRWLNVPPDMRAEAAASLRMLAPAVPLVVLATGARGILEANQQFKALNLLRIPSGVLMFVAPLFILPWTKSLVAVFAVLLAVRTVTLSAMLALCWHALPPLRHPRLARTLLPELLSFGGWMTVSNIVSPLMVQMDRFVIGATLSLAAVAHYATPFEMVAKILVIPTAVAGVAFPGFSRLLAQMDARGAARVYWRSIALVGGAMLPITLGLALYADAVLRLWLGEALPHESTIVMQILLAGVFANGLGHVPFAYLQGAGRADLTAKIHLAEAPVYALFLAFAVTHWGIVGAATAWTTRTLLDALCMHIARGPALKRLSARRPVHGLARSPLPKAQ